VKEFVWPIRVYYEDSDATGVVYYANYLRFMERARTEWLRSLGFEQDRLREKPGVLFVVRRAEVDYLQPARFNQLLEVSVRIAALRKASLVFEQEVRLAGGGALLARGRIKVACVDAERLRPAAIPAGIAVEIRDVR